MHLIAALWNHD